MATKKQSESELVETTVFHEFQVRRPLDVTIKIKPEDGPDNFRMALSRLASDVTYRERAMKEPTLIVRDFDLSRKELMALREAAVLSGADISRVDQMRAAEILVNASGMGVADVDVSCCSCCCCCCGETAIA